MIIDSPIISGSYAASGSLNQFGNVVISGSLTVTGSIIGTASFASTASYLSGYVSPFPFTGSAIISGSLDVTGSLKVTGSITSTGTITAQTLVVQTVSSSVIYSSGSNVFGNDLANTQRLTGSVSITGSLAVNGSNAILTNQTSSMSASYAVSASYALNSTSASFATTSSFSLNVPVTASFANTATSSSYALTSSFSLNVPVTASFANNATSASFATTASYLTGYISPFPYTGSAIISGSLGVTGSFKVTNLSGSGVRYLVADASGSITAQTASAAIKQTQAFTSSANQTSFTIDNGYTTGLVDVFINGSKLAPGVEFTDTTGTVITLATGSNSGDLVEFVKYFPASGVTNNALRQLTTFTASAAQTVFSASYTPGLLDIFYNGSRLSNNEYTANNGTFFTLATGSAAGDILDVFVYSYQVGAFSGIGGQGVANQVAYFGTTNAITGSPNFTISGSTMTVTGSLIVSGSGTFTNIGPAVFSGSLTSTAGFTGSFSGTATSASFASTASFVANAQSASYVLNAISSSFATRAITASYADSLTVAGTLTAQTLVVQTITSSVDFVTGSTRFGSILGNTHVFTGSVNITGSSTTIGTASFQTSGNNGIINLGGNTYYGQVKVDSNLGGIQINSIWGGANSGIIQLTNGTAGNVRLHIADNGNIGIGVTSPTSLLYVSASGGLSQDIVTIRGGGGSGAFGTRIESNNGDDLLYVNHFTYDITMATIAGNVGIGTNTPSSILQVQRDTNGDTPITFINGSGGSGNTNASITLDFILRNGSGGSSGGVKLKVGKETDHIGANVNDYFAISTTRNDAVGERFRISSGGNVYIGNTSGDGRFYVKTSVANGYSTSGYNGANANIRLETGGTPVTNTTTGIAFGVGGSAEAYIGAVQTSGGLAEIVFQNYDGAYRERMRITSAGQIYLNRFITSSTDVINIEAGSSFSGRGILINMDAGNDALTIGGSGSQNAINVTSSSKKVIISNLGGSGTVTVQADNSGTLIKASDSSLKQEDKEYKIQGLAEILQLQPRAYKWLKDIEVRKEQAVTEIGFFADEVNPIIPSAAPKGFDGLYGFNDRAVMATLVKAIQEQQAQIDELKAIING